MRDVWNAEIELGFLLQSIIYGRATLMHNYCQKDMALEYFQKYRIISIITSVETWLREICIHRACDQNNNLQCLKENTGCQNEVYFPMSWARWVWYMVWRHFLHDIYNGLWLQSRKPDYISQFICFSLWHDDSLGHISHSFLTKVGNYQFTVLAILFSILHISLMWWFVFGKI